MTYFLNGGHTRDLNKASPMKGAIAVSFAQLIRDIAGCSSGSVVSPVQFQKTVRPAYYIILVLLIVHLYLYLVPHTGKLSCPVPSGLPATGLPRVSSVPARWIVGGSVSQQEPLEEIHQREAKLQQQDGDRKFEP